MAPPYGGSVSDSWKVHADLAAAARALHAEPDTQHTLDRSALLAIHIIPNCHHAGVSITRRDGTINTPAASDDLVRREATSCSSSTGRGRAWTPSGTTTS